jgi:hypothetical protein
MAEKLPGLIDPNLPADQQPLKDTSNPNPVSRPPVAVHPDRFTPGNAVTPNAPAIPDNNQGAPSPDSSIPKKKQAAPKAPERSPSTTPPATPQSIAPQGDR